MEYKITTEMKKQVDITTGTPLSRNKSFSRKDKLKVGFVADDPKYTDFKNIKQKALTLIITVIIMSVMIYCVLFVGLKKTGFFGAETKNVQTIW